MAESNPTQVILTDDGLKIIKAQNTADEAVGNINDINSDNKLTPSEKIKLKQEYDKDLKLYAIDFSQLQSAGLSTTELETAMNNLTAFVTPLFQDMRSTSNVDRSALDGVFTAFATADKNASQAFTNKVEQVANDAKKAGDDAKQAGEKAQAVGEEAKQAASQAQADASQAKSDAATAQQKAQSSIDQLNAHLPDIDKALSATNLIKQDVTKLSNTTEQYHNEYTTGIQNVIKTIGDASTEIDQLNNAIKLKADSTDVTSQINVAVKGVQTDVTNKVSNLTTQINQTSDAVQFLASTAGSKNLVYNATFEQMTNGFPTGWTKDSNASNESGYVSGVPVSSYQGRNSIGVNTSKELGWVRFAQSDPQPLPIDNSADATNNVYSASMMVKVYGDGGAKASGRVFIVLAFFDANKARIQGGFNGVWSQTATESNEQWQLVKVENLVPVANAKYVGIQAFTYGVPTHAMINQPMINIGTTVQPFKPDMVNQASITASINNINLKVSNSDGSSSQVNINNDTILLDANKIIFNGNTSIQNGTIGTAKIANAAINTAQIADGAINNAKIANASIDNAKISNVSGDKIIARSITANKINVDDLIANGINTKTLTSVTLNTSTLTTPKLDLGMNGTFTEDFDYTQDTSLFLPKKNKGTLTFNHGVLQSRGTMQTYVNGQWGGMNDEIAFQSGLANAQWTELAPGYIKMDLFKQDGKYVAQRSYSDPTGFYYTSAKGDKSYLGNILQTAQVQSPSVLANYIGINGDHLRLQIVNNGNDYGLQVGSYAGGQAVLSDFIYNTAYSSSPNVYITPNGRLVRTTSASKYKYNIKNPDIETTLGDRLLNVHLATWNDKNAVDSYTEELNTGEKREKVSIDKCYGLIAEQLRDAGLDMFISYGENHEIEGVQYDRAWIPLLSVIRRLNDKVNEYELRLSKLEGVSK